MKNWAKAFGLTCVIFGAILSGLWLVVWTKGVALLVALFVLTVCAAHKELTP